MSTHDLSEADLDSLRRRLIARSVEAPCPRAEEPLPCRLWTGALDKDGYGRIKAAGHHHGVHRVAWRLFWGKWPEPNALHTCDVRACFRIEHLFEGTQTDNVLDAIAKGPDVFFGELRLHDARAPRYQ
jgi:HNH endonuclease